MSARISADGLAVLGRIEGALDVAAARPVPRPPARPLRATPRGERAAGLLFFAAVLVGLAVGSLIAGGPW